MFDAFQLSSNSRFAKRRIDAMHLPLGNEAREQAVQRAGGAQIRAEWFLQCQNNSCRQLHCGERLDDLLRHRGRQREVDCRLSGAVGEDLRQVIRVGGIRHPIATGRDDGLHFGRLSTA
jgi:hypothetical protein